MTRLKPIATGAALLAIWILLSGKLDALHLGAGAAAAALVVLYGRVSAGGIVPLLGVARFAPFLLWEILRSNLHVARLALSPRPVLTPRVVRVAPDLDDERALTMLGCSITMTPGTVTLDISREAMTVHALSEEAAREIEEGRMAARVARVFREGGA